MMKCSKKQLSSERTKALSNDKGPEYMHISKGEAKEWEITVT